MEHLSLNRVYIILLNWNNWPDTLECLESLFRLDYPNYRIVVCDNGSTDNSLEYLQAWASNRLDALAPPFLRKYSFPPVGKPIPCQTLDRQFVAEDDDSNGDVPLLFIRNGENLGFAGGNNVGLRYVLSKGDCAYAWLLNNDTVVDPQALTALVSRMEENVAAGICGSTLLEYSAPEKIQALGGAYYNRWFAVAWHLGRLRRKGDYINQQRIETQMNYVIGASMLVRKKFLQKIGLMCEDYFLYFEEIDWCMRARNHFSLAYAPESFVYHKVGSSIGTSSNPAKKSTTCDFYNLRNRLFFTWRYFPWALPTVYFGLLGALLVRLLLGQWGRARVIMSLMVNFRTSRFPVIG
jgi:hypothetical protein